MFDRKVLLAILATSLSTVASYEVEMTYPPPTWMSRGSNQEDEVPRRDGILNTFPCSNTMDGGNREPIPLYPDTNTLCLSLGLPTAERGRGISEDDVGAWEVNYWWGRFEDAPFENGEESYLWGRALSRQNRVVGEGLWSSAPLEIPDRVRTLGEDSTVRARRFDREELDGTRAMLAVRVSHFDRDEDLSRGDIVPTNITNYCSFVQFMANLTDPIRTCGRVDTTVGSPIIINWSPQQLPPTTTRAPSYTASYTASYEASYTPFVWPTETSTYDPNDPSHYKNPWQGRIIGGLLGGLGGFLLLMLLCWLFCGGLGKSTRQEKQEEDIRAHGLGGYRGEPRSELSTQEVSVTRPPPASYRIPLAHPEPELLREYRMAAEMGVRDGSQPVVELPPAYAGLVSPPVYVENDGKPAGRSHW
ncbi:hypothetical protein F5X68DRAFT_227559 [Plectosphaerella plurivora]|uniref:Uncharacterized protein n=1 Tax=Plectosphaerella plurivora TaxID=936078 RepID=A0A9P8VL18_9PEZI|nr:hypothetical protein F5X68DRAFT_227559 [Plectosphaerella plurivora]